MRVAGDATAEEGESEACTFDDSGLDGGVNCLAIVDNALFLAKEDEEGAWECDDA